MNEYDVFLQSKKMTIKESGINIKEKELSEYLFPYQKDISKWAIKKGRCAIFTNTGTGKTNMQLEWAKQLYEKLGISILILSPLAVREQTIQEAKKWLNLTINDQRINGFKPGINITNYQQLDNIDPSLYQGIVLDESSILKSLSSSTRQKLIAMFANTPYKLACTATPSPNDYMELGNHAEFLNIMKRSEMLSMFFVHDGETTSEWRLKGHAEVKFWEWVSSWAVVMQSPEDLGYESTYKLPKLEIETIIVKKDFQDNNSFFPRTAKTLDERREARKGSIKERVEIAAKIANQNNEMYLIWTDFNKESEDLSKLVKGGYQITGSDSDEYKAETMLKFAKGEIRIIISKPRLAGFGMNWQACHNVIYCGLSDSFEQYYQSIRRCYRYGQKYPVKVWVIISSGETEVLKNIQRKEADFNKMMKSITKNTKKYMIEQLHLENYQKTEYNPNIIMKLPKFIKGDML